MHCTQVCYVAPMLPVEAAQKQHSLAGCVMRHHGTHHSLIHSWQRPCQYPQGLPSHSCQTLHPRYHPQQKTYEQCSNALRFVDVMRHLSYYHELEKLVTW